jgi:hypothetical protein
LEDRLINFAYRVVHENFNKLGSKVSVNCEIDS